MNSKSEVAYRYYPLEKEMTINGRKFTEIIIDPHFEKNHPYMNDKKILEIVKQIDKKDGFVPHRQGILPNGKVIFSRAVLLWKSGSSFSLILRRK